jgi:hypothetical protein
MAIAPTSRVQLFGDIGIDLDHEDCLYFASESEKTTWFNNKTKLVDLTSQYYIRKDKRTLRISPPNGISSVYGAFYMRYTNNAAYENKWFYAYVLSVDYVNDSTVEVVYENDPMMTWMGDFTLAQCFIERQHAESDKIGENTVEENLEVGEHINEGTISKSIGSQGWCIAIWRTFDPEFDSMGINPVKQGTYSPVVCNYYDISNSNEMEQLDELLYTGENSLTKTNRIDQVIGMKLIPKLIAQATSNTIPFTVDPSEVTKPYSNFINNTHIPKNKKLFTYPYKYLRAENGEGTNVVYKYEYFRNYPPNQNANACQFRLLATSVSPEVSLMMIPKDYDNKPFDFSKSIEMTKFPSVAWNVDTYKAYLAQRDSTLVGDITSRAISGGISGGLGGFAASGFNPVGAVAGFATGTIGGITSSSLIKDTVNALTGQSRYIMPDETRGKTDSNLLVQDRKKDFTFYKMCITPERMKIIDNYFTMYGYAMKVVDTPKMHVRTHFTYVKTIGCLINAKSGWNIPALDASQIEKLFDKGVRFWDKDAVIGKYDVTNAILS